MSIFRFELLFSLLYFIYVSIAIILPILIAPKYFILKNRSFFNKRTYTIVIVVLFIPVLGMAITLSMAIIFRIIANRPVREETTVISVPEYSHEISLLFSHNGIGSIANRLKFSVNDNDRIRSISQIKESNFNEQYRLLHSALTDPAEEVRLLAYSAIDRREHENTVRVIKLNSMIKSINDPDLKLKLQQNKAWLMWNIKHQKDIINYSLDYQKSYEGGSNLSPEATFLPYFLKGLMQLENNNYDCAIDAFRKASLQETDSLIIIPFLAKAYFLSGKYTEVANLFRNAEAIRLSPRYGLSAKFWGDIQ